LQANERAPEQSLDTVNMEAKVLFTLVILATLVNAQVTPMQQGALADLDSHQRILFEDRLRGSLVDAAIHKSVTIDSGNSCNVGEMPCLNPVSGYADLEDIVQRTGPGQCPTRQNCTTGCKRTFTDMAVGNITDNTWQRLLNGENIARPSNVDASYALTMTSTQ